MVASLGASPAFARTVRSRTNSRISTTSIRASGSRRPTSSAAPTSPTRSSRSTGSCATIGRTKRSRWTSAFSTCFHSLRATLGSRRRFEVFSAYRSPSTNAALFEEGYGVAEHSFHLVGKAIDDQASRPLRAHATPRGGPTSPRRRRLLSSAGLRPRRRRAATPLVAAASNRCGRPRRRLESRRGEHSFELRLGRTVEALDRSWRA